MGLLVGTVLLANRHWFCAKRKRIRQEGRSVTYSDKEQDSGVTCHHVPGQGAVVVPNAAQDEGNVEEGRHYEEDDVGTGLYPGGAVGRGKCGDE